MADAADIAGDNIDNEMERRIAAAGDCELCGEWSGRLIGGACSPCRDRYGLE